MPAALLVAALLAPAPAQAQPLPWSERGPDLRPAVTHVVTARDLAAICDPLWRGVPRLEAIAYCQGYLTAAVQFHALTRPPGGPLPPLFCVPGRGPSIAESGIAFADWVRRNPQHAAEPALDAFLRWAEQMFPCGRASSWWPF